MTVILSTCGNAKMREYVNQTMSGNIKRPYVKTNELIS